MTLPVLFAQKLQGFMPEIDGNADQGIKKGYQNN